MSVKGRIVVIDDEVNAAAALETLLREDGYDVARAHDGRSGLQLLEKHDPDVVLTDLRMPGMDGIELLAKIKEIRPETMVIVMTAYGTVKTAVKAMKLGAEDYLGKPIDVEELEVVLQKALERKGLLEEARSLRERLEHK
jgi:DNA-binding NtrC family response regulator